MKFSMEAAILSLLAVFGHAMMEEEEAKVSGALHTILPPIKVLEDSCDPTLCEGDPCANMDGIGGKVFQDSNGDGLMQDREKGVCGVMVSNGLKVVKTECNGCYKLPFPTSEEEAAGMFYFVTEPDGYDVPRNTDNVPQFYYMHKPTGSPLNVHNESFRFGGLPPTGELPAQIDFPLIKTEPKPHFKIVTSGDTQTYSNDEMNYYRDTVVKEWVAMDDLDAIILMGDVMGDE